MFFEISKIFNIFVSPISWMLLLLLGAYLCKSGRGRRICVGAFFLVFFLFTDQLFYDWAKRCFVSEFNQSSLSMNKKYRMAVVMGGFASMDRESGQICFEQDQAGRLWEAIRLWKTGKVHQIFISGDATSNIQDDGHCDAPFFLTYMAQFGVPASAFVLEKQAKNTYQNALYVKDILTRAHVAPKQCLLITADTHMKRSLRCFKKVGFEMDYHAVNTFDHKTNYTHRDYYPKWDVAARWQVLMNEMVGDAVYALVGYN